jgi:hypothetical protein
MRRNSPRHDVPSRRSGARPRTGRAPVDLTARRATPGAEAQVVSAARTQAEQEQRKMNQHVS